MKMKKGLTAGAVLLASAALLAACGANPLLAATKQQRATLGLAWLVM